MYEINWMQLINEKYFVKVVWGISIRRVKIKNEKNI